MRKKLLFFITFIFIFLFCHEAFATAPCPIEAEAIILMEANTGKILYEKNANKKMYPASTTKILTAMIALELADLEDIVTVGNEVLTIPVDSSKAGHLPGEKLTIRDLLMGLMLPSGNDSAVTIACHIARKATKNPNLSLNESIYYFSEMANQLAHRLGATKTHFVNPHGYHDENHYTTAYDLALIAQEAMKNEFFREVVATSSYTIKSSVEEQKEYLWENTNLLINQNNPDTYYFYTTGLKTGFTTPAGECLVASASKDNMDLIAVLLNSPKDQRWEEAKTLFQYGFENFIFHQIVEENEALENILAIDYSSKKTYELELAAANGFADFFLAEDIPIIQKQIIWKKELIDSYSEEEVKLLAPIKKGDIIGTIQYILDDKVLAEVDIVASDILGKQKLWKFIFYFSLLIIFILILYILRLKHRRRKRQRRGRRGRRSRKF